MNTRFIHLFIVHNLISCNSKIHSFYLSLSFWTIETSSVLNTNLSNLLHSTFRFRIETEQLASIEKTCYCTCSKDIRDALFALNTRTYSLYETWRIETVVRLFCVKFSIGHFTGSLLRRWFSLMLSLHHTEEEKEIGNKLYPEHEAVPVHCSVSYSNTHLRSSFKNQIKYSTQRNFCRCCKLKK